jgi:hypothetical protein
VNLKPLDFDKSVNLGNKEIKCGPVSASLSVDLDGQAHATASVGVAATGTIIPPKVSNAPIHARFYRSSASQLTDFGIITGLTANVAGTLDLKADVSGEVDSGKITLLNLGIPGLDFPGILTVGPSLQVRFLGPPLCAARLPHLPQLAAQVTASLDVNLDMNVRLCFSTGTSESLTSA